jgi:NCS1 family nucleobase:cation symporter-1
VAANIVSPANAIANIYPKKISFRKAGFAAAVLGIVILPWNFVNSPGNFLEKWLIGSSCALGSLGAIMISDYYLHKKTVLDISQLYDTKGQLYRYYKGWNLAAFICVFLGIVPVIPGMFSTFGWIQTKGGFYDLFSYSWFVTFSLSGGLYSAWILMQKNLPRYAKLETLDEEQPMEETPRDIVPLDTDESDTQLK